MALRPGGEEVVIREQIIEDASGLVFQFELVADPDAPFRLRVFGESLPFGNRELLFDGGGVFVGGGTFVQGLCRPTWMTDAGRVDQDQIDK